MWRNTCPFNLIMPEILSDPTTNLSAIVRTSTSISPELIVGFSKPLALSKIEKRDGEYILYSNPEQGCGTTIHPLLFVSSSGRVLLIYDNSPANHSWQEIFQLACKYILDNCCITLIGPTLQAFFPGCSVLFWDNSKAYIFNGFEKFENSLESVHSLMNDAAVNMVIGESSTELSDSVYSFKSIFSCTEDSIDSFTTSFSSQNVSVYSKNSQFQSTAKFQYLHVHPSQNTERLPKKTRVPYRVIQKVFQPENLKDYHEKVPKGSRRAAPKRQKKDPARPKGYISAFNFFAKAHHKMIRGQDQTRKYESSTMRTNAINKYVGKLWKSLSVKDKEMYEIMATEDKERYLREMSEYSPTDGYECEAPRINPIPNSKRCETPSEIYGSPCTQETCGPVRPKAAYTHFASHERKALSTGSNFVKTNMSKIYGQRWQLMSKSEISCYFSMEYADKARYEDQLGGLVSLPEEPNRVLGKKRGRSGKKRSSSRPAAVSEDDNEEVKVVSI